MKGCQSVKSNDDKSHHVFAAAIRRGLISRISPIIFIRGNRGVSIFCRDLGYLAVWPRAQMFQLRIQVTPICLDLHMAIKL